MALLQSGVGIAVLALWLGHENKETTNVYVHANLAMKEKALEKVQPIATPFHLFRADHNLLTFFGITLTMLSPGRGMMRSVFFSDRVRQSFLVNL
jgi:hypothetical protein